MILKEDTAGDSAPNDFKNKPSDTVANDKSRRNSNAGNHHDVKNHDNTTQKGVDRKMHYESRGSSVNKNRIIGTEMSKSVPRSGEKNIMRLIIKSYDTDFLDSTARFMCEVLNKNAIKYSGPVALPISTRRFVVKSSPHVYKDARHRFEIRESTRMIEFEESPSAISALSGVDSIHPSVSVKTKRIVRKTSPTSLNNAANSRKGDNK